ncbi:MAG TPA: hypothetical protein VMW17_12330 [Candidatus Binatia bacterium]|nr:hypothetical protein [Candidatus Binatia bacterium]
MSEASFNGHIVFSNWSRAEVEKLLPPDLELCANISATPDIHPVVFIFGDQAQGAMLFGGFTFSLGVQYQELGVAVPFVKHRRDPLIHTFMARMYSSYDIATWNGNFHYGFSKVMAKLGWRGPVYLVTAEDGALLLHATVADSGEWLSGDRCTLPNFAAVQWIFSLPVVGRRANGIYVRSYFGWDFGAAQVRTADACGSIDAPFLPGLTPQDWHDVSAGTFEVRNMIWRLSWPSALL